MREPSTMRDCVRSLHRGHWRRLKILLVDDNEVLLMALRGLLRLMGHTIDMARNGREAVEAATRDNYDVVFLDIQMPEMGGYEAAQALRMDFAVGTPPRIVGFSGRIGGPGVVRRVRNGRLPGQARPAQRPGTGPQAVARSARPGTRTGRRFRSRADRLKPRTGHDTAAPPLRSVLRWRTAPPPGRARAAADPRRGSRGDPRQEPLSGQHEPRNPHPDERHRGDGRTAQGDRSRRSPARLRGDD